MIQIYVKLLKRGGKVVGVRQEWQQENIAVDIETPFEGPDAYSSYSEITHHRLQHG